MFDDVLRDECFKGLVAFLIFLNHDYPDDRPLNDLEVAKVKLI